MYPFESWLSQAEDHLKATGRPLVSLSYAQSLDGSLSSKSGQSYPISGAQALALTHHLRSQHAAILVGVRTVLADDPRLTARSPDPLSNLPQPRPIVLDSSLHTPPEARLFQAADRAPWVATTLAAPQDRRAALQAARAEIIDLPADEHGKVSLPDLLVCLGQRGIASLMVEGGGRVLQAFLTQQLADLVIITLAPLFLGGVPVLEPWGRSLQVPVELTDAGSQPLGQDIIIWGRLNSLKSQAG